MVYYHHCHCHCVVSHVLFEIDHDNGTAMGHILSNLLNTRYMNHISIGIVSVGIELPAGCCINYYTVVFLLLPHIYFLSKHL